MNKTTMTMTMTCKHLPGKIHALDQQHIIYMDLYKYIAAVRRKNLKELQHQSVDDQLDLRMLDEGGVVAEDVVVDEEGDNDEEVHVDKEHIPDMTTMVPVRAPI